MGVRFRASTQDDCGVDRHAGGRRRARGRLPARRRRPRPDHRGPGLRGAGRHDGPRLRPHRRAAAHQRRGRLRRRRHRPRPAAGPPRLRPRHLRGRGDRRPQPGRRSSTRASRGSPTATPRSPPWASPRQAEEAYGADQVEALEYNLGGNGKSQILGTAGFVKLVRRKDGPVVGVRTVGARMGEQVGEAQLIVNWEAYPEEVAQLVHAHPTQNESLGEAHLALAGKPLHSTPDARAVSPLVTRPRRTNDAVRADARARGERHRGHRHPLAQVGRRHRRGRRAAAGGLDRQGRHRDPVPGRRHADARSSSHEDETVEVGADLAVIGDADEAAAGSGERLGGGRVSSPTPEPEPEPSRRRRPEQPAGARSGGSDAGGSRGPAATPPVTMPALGESVTEGTVTRWLKAVGDTVEVDEPLLEVSTDKVDTEIPSPVAGTLLEILVAEDETVEVGAAAWRSSAAATPARRRAAAPRARRVRRTPRPVTWAPRSRSAAPRRSSPRTPPSGSRPRPEAARRPRCADLPQPDRQVAPEAPAGASGAEQASEDYNCPRPADRRAGAAPGRPGHHRRVRSRSDISAYVTPLVRKLAQSEGVDLSTVTGTGVGGRIRKQDVTKAAEAAKAAAAAKAAQPAAAAPRPHPRRRPPRPPPPRRSPPSAARPRR